MWLQGGHYFSLCSFQSHLSIKCNLWCFHHKLLGAGTSSYSLHSIEQHGVRATRHGCLQCDTNNGGFTTRARGQSFALSIQDLRSGVAVPSEQLRAVDEAINLTPAEDKRTAATDDGSRSRNLLSPGDSLPFLDLPPLLHPGGSSAFLWIGKVPGQSGLQLLLSPWLSVWYRGGRGHWGEGAVGCWHTESAANFHPPGAHQKELSESGSWATCGNTLPLPSRFWIELLQLFIFKALRFLPALSKAPLSLQARNSKVCGNSATLKPPE